MEVNNNILIIGEIIKYLNHKKLDDDFIVREISTSNDVLEITYEYKEAFFVFSYIFNIDFKNEKVWMYSYLNPKIFTNSIDIPFDEIFKNEKNKKDFIEIVNNIGSENYDISKNDLYIQYKLYMDI